MLTRHLYLDILPALLITLVAFLVLAWATMHLAFLAEQSSLPLGTIKMIQQVYYLFGLATATYLICMIVIPALIIIKKNIRLFSNKGKIIH